MIDWQQEYFYLVNKVECECVQQGDLAPIWQAFKDMDDALATTRAELAAQKAREVGYVQAMDAMGAELTAAHATIHQLGENAAKAAGEYAAEVARLREALQPFAFLDMGRDEDEGVPFATQEVWQTIYRDRVQDWISFEELDAARAALTEPTDG